VLSEEKVVDESDADIDERIVDDDIVGFEISSFIPCSRRRFFKDDCILIYVALRLNNSTKRISNFPFVFRRVFFSNGVFSSLTSQ
jgi:hypothetical protein